MSLSSFDIPSGGYRTVSPCSAQLVETFGPDGKSLHQEVIIHLLPSNAQPMMTGAFFHPLQSHGRGVMSPMNYPSKSSSVITSIYVDNDNPRTFRVGIRAFYPQEHQMKAQEAVEALEQTISELETAKQKIEENDTNEFDIDRKVNLISEVAEEINEYLADQLD